MRARRTLAVLAVSAALALGFGVPAGATGERAPGLPRADRYAGPLYSVSEKVGDNPLVVSRLLPGMARNQVTTAVLYFGVESRRDPRFIEQVLRAAPGRIVPFYSTGIGGRGEGRLAGPALLRAYRKGLAASRDLLGPEVVRGIGEVEIYAWSMPHDDARVRSLVAFAARNGLDVMIHPARGRLAEFERLVAAHPGTTFLMHLFTLDFDSDRQQVIDLMTRNPNLYYTVDVDHMLLDTTGPYPIGLLYKYADQPVRQAVAGFVRDFDAQRAQLLDAAVTRYAPLVQAHPDRVMWGTEMSEDYTYDPAVYDRMIAFTRDWLAGLPAQAQEPVARGNALRVLGPGVTLR